METKIKVKYIQREEDDNLSNLSEIKLFCGEKVTISLEYAPGIDTFFDVRVEGKPVPVNDYIVKLPDNSLKVIHHNQFETEWVTSN